MATLAELRRGKFAPPRAMTLDLRPPIDFGAAEEKGVLEKLWQPARSVFKGMGAVDEKTRALAGLLTGLEATEGREPTGEELFTHWTGAELPENVEGDIEWRDVPGFATDVLVSPFNLLPLGQLTKAGRLAARGTNLAKRARALRAIGTPERLKEARELRPAIRAIREQARRMGVPQTLRPGWREQAAAGAKQRSLIGLDVPTFGIPGLRRLPITGGGVRLLPGGRTLGGLQKLGQGIRRPFREAGRLFRVGGRMPAGGVISRGGRELLGEDYNALISGVEESVRGGRRIGQEEHQRIIRTLRSADAGQAERALERLKRTLPGMTEEAVSAAPLVRRLERSLERARLAGDANRFERITTALDKARRRFRRKYELLPRGGRDARLASMVLGLEQGGVPGKLAEKSAAIEATYAEKVGRWQSARNVALAAGDRRAASRAQATITRLEQNLNDHVQGLAARSKLSKEVWAALPEEIQGEVGRVAALTDETLKIEQQVGVPVSELWDSLLSYLHRSLTPEGYQFARQLEKLRLDTPFTRYGRQFTVEKGFVKRRVRAFEGRGSMSLNDWANDLAGELRGEGVDVKFGKKGPAEFFAENPAEAVMRRMTAGGKARASAELFGGMIEMLNIPAAAARRGDVPVAEFLEKAQLRRVRGEKIPRKAGAIAAALKGTRYENMFIPREFANAALDTFRVLDTPEELKHIAKFFDKYNAMMRFHVTVPWLGYHVRNVLSNVWMCWLAGMRNPALFGEAMGIQRRAARAAKAGATSKELLMLQRMADMGAAGGGMTGELAALLGEAGGPTLRMGQRRPGIVRGLLEPGKTRVGQGMMAGAAALENNAKIALYLDGLKSGLSEFEAAERVKKFLFDYGALGPADRAIRKWAFFWTFWRKNLPLQIESLFTNTRKMHAWAALGGQLGDSAQTELLPEYKRGRNPITAGLTKEGERRFLSLGLPFEDLFSISGEGRPGLSGARRIGQRLWGMGAPLVRALPEVLTGQSLSSGQPTTAGRIATGLTPASRWSSTARRLVDVAKGERPREDLLSLVGLSTMRADPRRARLRKMLQAVNARLEEEAFRGRARVFKGYYQRRGERDPELSRLLRLRSALESMTARKR